MNGENNNRMEELFILWFRVSESIKNRYQRSGNRKKTKELTMSQIRVISSIFIRSSGQTRIKDIAEELGITAGAVSQSVDMLVNAGLLTRCKDERDRRAVSVSLSDYGQQIRKDVFGAFSGMFSSLFSDIPEEKIVVFSEVLETMLNYLEQNKK